MKFIFIRHAKDDQNYRGGWSNLDITKEGKEQALKLENYLEENEEKFQLKKIISSDLKRAVSTANIINEKMKLHIELDKNLREMNNGDLAGMLNEEALEKYPGVFFNTLEINEKYPNGESPLEFYNRIKTWLFNAIKQYKNYDGNIIIVTHAGVINIIYYIVKNLEWSNKAKSFKIVSCSINVLDIDKMKFEVENYTKFLE